MDIRQKLLIMKTKTKQKQNKGSDLFVTFSLFAALALALRGGHRLTAIVATMLLAIHLIDPSWVTESIASTGYLISAACRATLTLLSVVFKKRLN